MKIKSGDFGKKSSDPTELAILSGIVTVYVSFAVANPFPTAERRASCFDRFECMWIHA